MQEPSQKALNDLDYILNKVHDNDEGEIKIEISDITTEKPLNTIHTDNHGRNRINTIFGEGIGAGINWEFNSNFAYQGDNRKLQQKLLNGEGVYLL